ncbi:MAG: hypothetical protein RI897_1827 [Verrucomicrobiota bacterium]
MGAEELSDGDDGVAFFLGVADDGFGEFERFGAVTAAVVEEEDGAGADGLEVAREEFRCGVGLPIGAVGPVDEGVAHFAGGGFDPGAVDAVGHSAEGWGSAGDFSDGLVGFLHIRDEVTGGFGFCGGGGLRGGEFFEVLGVVNVGRGMGGDFVSAFVDIAEGVLSGLGRFTEDEERGFDVIAVEDFEEFWGFGAGAVVEADGEGFLVSGAAGIEFAGFGAGGGRGWGGPDE